MIELLHDPQAALDAMVRLLWFVFGAQVVLALMGLAVWRVAHDARHYARRAKNEVHALSRRQQALWDPELQERLRADHLAGSHEEPQALCLWCRPI